jgi:hypothetical protein
MMAVVGDSKSSSDVGHPFAPVHVRSSDSPAKDNTVDLMDDSISELEDNPLMTSDSSALVDKTLDLEEDTSILLGTKVWPLTPVHQDLLLSFNSDVDKIKMWGDCPPFGNE